MQSVRVPLLCVFTGITLHYTAAVLVVADTTTTESSDRPNHTTKKNHHNQNIRSSFGGLSREACRLKAQYFNDIATSAASTNLCVRDGNTRAARARDGKAPRSYPVQQMLASKSRPISCGCTLDSTRSRPQNRGSNVHGWSQAPRFSKSRAASPGGPRGLFRAPPRAAPPSALFRPYHHGFAWTCVSERKGLSALLFVGGGVFCCRCDKRRVCQVKLGWARRPSKQSEATPPRK